MDASARIAVVGGGITGLACAYFLKARYAPRRITVFESTARLGGNIRSERHGGLTLDVGPDAWVTSKPAATRLAEALGLASQLMVTPAQNRRVYVGTERGLVPLPSGLLLGIPTTLGSFAGTPLFSAPGKARIAAELLVPRRRFDDDEDESISEFVTRRLGREACDRLVAPLLGGIFSGDAHDISIRAGAPQLVRMEETFGSLILGARAERRARAASGEAHAFVSLPGGVERLVERLVDEIGDVDVRTRAKVHEILPEGQRFACRLDDGARETFDAVVLTAPAFALAPMVSTMNERLSTLLKQLHYGSTALVFLAFPRATVGMSLDSTGFLVPRSTGSELVATTILSSKWEGRAPPSTALFRLFFGGNRGPGVLDRSDEELVRLGVSELGRFVPLRGDPTEAFVRRLRLSSPQPRTGHLRWLADVRGELARHPGLLLAGNGYGGVGIPDCIRQARESATSLGC